MGTRPGERVGIIYGEVASTHFKFAASDPDVKRLDYVSAQHPAGVALCQIVDVQRQSELSFEEAVSLGGHGSLATGDHMSCGVRVIGYRDERGLLQTPRTPFKAGTEVRRASADVVQKVLGLTANPDEGVYLGHLKGTDIPVVLDAEILVQKHASILAKTGAGKSYAVGVIIEELLKRRVALVIVDPHGEYGTLANPNIEPKEVDNLIRFHLKPKSFATNLKEYALDTRLAPGATKLALDGSHLEAQDILDLLGGKASSAQQGLLYQAINALKKTKPYYALADITEELGRTPSNAKWPLIAAIENLQGTQLFATPPTPLTDVVRPGNATLLNLKGTQPEVAEIVVARLARALFDARKRDTVPPFLLVVEEAHNFCPERGLGAARSGQELRTIASEGRKFGMGLLIVSQRPAKVDKNVLSQCNTQIILKVTNPNDLKAITHSVEGLTGDAADEIQRLDTGVSLVAGGRLTVPILVEVRTRQTRHGGRSVSVVVDEEEAEAYVTQPPSAAEAESIAHEPPPEPDLVPAEPAASEPPEAVEVEPVDPPLPGPELPEVAPPGPQRKQLRPASADLSTKAPWGPQVELEEQPEPPLKGPAPPPRGPLAPRPAPERPPEPTPPVDVGPVFEPEDMAVHRVLTRIGYEGARNAREGVLKVKELARSVALMDPDAYVHAFARIAKTYCFPSLPECGPCPLRHQCKMGLRRLALGEVRDGRWGTRRT